MMREWPVKASEKRWDLRWGLKGRIWINEGKEKGRGLRKLQAIVICEVFILKFSYTHMSIHLSSLSLKTIVIMVFLLLFYK